MAANATKSVKTRSTSLAEDSFAEFAEKMDSYIKNSSVFKQVICSAVNTAVEEIVKPLQAEIASLKSEVARFKLKLAEMEAKTNDNEQYSRRNNIEGEDCYKEVLKLCEKDLNIELVKKKSTEHIA